jgi:hypothetical protein
VHIPVAEVVGAHACPRVAQDAAGLVAVTVEAGQKPLADVEMVT